MAFIYKKLSKMPGGVGYVNFKNLYDHINFFFIIMSCYVKAWNINMIVSRTTVSNKSRLSAGGNSSHVSAEIKRQQEECGAFRGQTLACVGVN